MEPIHVQIGRRLQQIRKRRGLSLERTAELTGVSKAMLGQIERGETSPTITTLWKIAKGLHVSFSSLIEGESESVRLVDWPSMVPLTEEGGRYRVYPLFPFDAQKHFEIYGLELDAGCVHEAEAHSHGVEEYVLVSEGELELVLGDETYILTPGRAVRFSADRAHTYRNRTLSVTRLHMLIYYPN